MIKPILDSYISSPYGDRLINGIKQFHKGYDISSKTNNKILNIETGLIVVKGFSKDFGNRIYIKCKDYYIIYAHMDRFINNKNVGDVIMVGEEIGIMGETGLSFGKHLHIEFCDSTLSNRNSFKNDKFEALYH